jgi:hypothetical protein
VTTAQIVAGAIIVFVALGGIALWLLVRQSRKLGGAEAERDQFQVKSEQARRANEIDEDVARTPIADIDNELRNGG